MRCEGYRPLVASVSDATLGLSRETSVDLGSVRLVGPGRRASTPASYSASYDANNNAVSLSMEGSVFERPAPSSRQFLLGREPAPPSPFM